MRWNRALVLGAALAAIFVDRASADLLLYEPFDYTTGDQLGGVDPDGAGPLTGTPVGKTNAGGGVWHARSAVDYQAAQDAVVSPGNLSYAGLAASAGNSVSYGSALPNPANDAFNKSLYADSIALPAPVTEGSLYASFIIRIKSDVEDGTANSDRFSPVSFVTDVTPPATLGQSLAGQAGASGVRQPGGFWLRRDPADATLTTMNFGVGKFSSDGTPPGHQVGGTNAGWQHSGLGANVEANQFGDLDGQPEPVFADANTWQTYFVVVKYEFDFANASAGDFDASGATPAVVGQNDTVSLWVNPGPGTLGVANGEILASQAASGAIGSYYAALDSYTGNESDAESINSIALIGHRQTTNNTIAVDVDELRVGTTWADVTPAAAEENADFDGDDDVDGADFLTWQRGLGGAATLANGNANGDGAVDGADLAIWESQFGTATPAAGAVPEPSSVCLLVVGLGVAAAGRRATVARRRA
jgi:hypothetical protein